jgi:hypothetical protein
MNTKDRQFMMFKEFFPAIVHGLAIQPNVEYRFKLKIYHAHTRVFADTLYYTDMYVVSLLTPSSTR